MVGGLRVNGNIYNIHNRYCKCIYYYWYLKVYNNNKVEEKWMNIVSFTLCLLGNFS